MSTYELDDDLVKRLLDGKQLVKDAKDLRLALQEQLPIPVPTKIGAVVRTESEAFLHADGSTTPWIRVRLPGVAFVERPDWFADDQIGRITEVLSEGVDL